MPYHLVYTSRRSDWKVLANLTAGALSTRVFYNPCYASETTKVASKRKMRLPPIPARRPLFSSMHFTHPEHVDVARELCHFKKGFQLSNTTRKLISNNLADVISSQLLCDAVTVCDMNPLDEVIDLLVVIFSRPFRTHQRKLVRKYWGRDDCYAGRNVRHVFLTGVPAQSNAGEVKKLLSEAEQERDLVVQDFADSNNFAEMYKMLLGLRWSLAYCKSAKLVLFTSDEIFLVPENVVGFIESVSDDVREHLVAGKFVARGRVERRKGKPEYVPKTEYAIAEWPDSVSPHALFVGAELLLDLYIAARMTRPVRHSRGLLGISLMKLQIIPWDMPNLYLTEDQLKILQSNKNHTNQLVAARLLTGNDAFQHKTATSWWNLHKCEEMCAAKPADA